MNEEAIRQWLRSLSQEMRGTLYHELKEMFEVRQPKFSQDSHYSEESGSSVVIQSLDNSVAFPFSYGKDSTGNECLFYETNSDPPQATRMEPTTGSITGTTAKNKKQKMCSKYSFVDDEKEWILEQFEIERDSLRKEGKEGTVE